MMNSKAGYGGVFGGGLVLLNQGSLAQENVSQNGVHKHVHVVVKNTPFNIHLRMEENGTFNFNNVTVEAQLMYDCEDEKFVDFVRKQPMEYKAQINNDQLVMETRIKVLTSQLEDMLFKMRLRCVDSKTKQPIPGLYCTTEPIKVVSKPEQVERIKQPQISRPKKRSANEVVQDSLSRIEKQQSEQFKLLEKLYTHAVHQLSAPKPFPKKDMSDCFMDEDCDVFETTFMNMLDIYTQTEPSDRPSKLRRIVRKSSGRSTESMLEMVSQLQYELQQETQHNALDQQRLVHNSAANYGQSNLQQVSSDFRSSDMSVPFNFPATRSQPEYGVNSLGSSENSYFNSRRMMLQSPDNLDISTAGSHNSQKIEYDKIDEFYKHFLSLPTAE